MKKLYQKYIKNKLFNKLMLLYACFFLISLLFLGAVFCSFFYSKQKKNDINYFVRAIDDTNVYINNTASEWKKNVYNFYYEIYDNKELATFFDNSSDNYQINKKHYLTYATSLLNSNENTQKVSLYRSSDLSIVSANRNNSINMNEAQEREAILRDSTYIEDTGVALTSSPYGMRITLQLNQYYANPSAYGYITADIQNKPLDYNLNNYTENNNAIFLIMQKDGMVVYDSSNQNNGKIFSYIDKIDNAPNLKMGDEKYRYKTLKIDGKTMCVLRNNQNSLNLDVVCLFSLDDIKKQTNSIILIVFICVLLAFILSICVIYFITNFFSFRIQTLVGQIKSTRNHALNLYEFDLAATDEIGEIARQFAETFQEQQNYMKRAYDYEIYQKNASFHLLQSQINPHFLFNTLEAIRMKAIDEGSEETSQIIYYMATLLRQTIKKQEISTICAELEYITMYIELFRLRYPNMISFIIQADEDTLQYGILTNLVQPLVENCIIHGFSPSIENYLIEIHVYCENDNLLVNVTDNGIGINPLTLEKIEQKLSNGFKQNEMNSIGLSNVNERIKLIYGEKYGIIVSSIAGKSTSVKMTLKRWTEEEVENNAQALNR